MQAAVIAAEDRTFYSNRGIDLRGIIRAARNNAQSGAITGGGSTITQQYVKILYLSQEQSYTRKVREAILSIKIHNQLSKQEILEGYLNTIYFGNGAYGVQVASRTYFDKPASELDTRESAALATILNQPSFYDPYSDDGQKQMIPRYQYVLDGMAKAGAISAADAAEAQRELPTFAKQKDNNRFQGPNGHVLRLVQEKMNQLEFTDDQVLGGGLKITTTIGYQKQRAAIKAVESIRPAGKKQLHPALVSIQPGTGAVKAMYGGADYLENQLNWATSGTQPGSTFKIFALIAALEDGYSLKTRLNGSSPIQVGGSTIENQGDSGGQSFGPVTLERATQKSINTAFVDLTQQLGTDEDDANDGSTGGRHQWHRAHRGRHGRHPEDPGRREPGRHPGVGHRQVRPGRSRHAARLRAGGSRRHGQRVRDGRRGRQEVRVVRHPEGRGPGRVHAARARSRDRAVDTEGRRR